MPRKKKTYKKKQFQSMLFLYILILLCDWSSSPAAKWGVHQKQMHYCYEHFCEIFMSHSYWSEDQICLDHTRIHTLTFKYSQISDSKSFCLLHFSYFKNSKFGKDAQISTPLKVFWPQCFHAILHTGFLYYFSRDCKLRMRT